MIYDAFFLFVKIFRAILSCLPRIYRECHGTAMTLIQTPLLIGERRKKDTGGAGRGHGAEIGDGDRDQRRGDTKIETETGGGQDLGTGDQGQDLETEGPDRDLCPLQDREMKGPGIIVKSQLWRKGSQVQGPT